MKATRHFLHMFILGAVSAFDMSGSSGNLPLIDMRPQARAARMRGYWQKVGEHLQTQLDANRAEQVL